jgi:hypothetical protein
VVPGLASPAYEIGICSGLVWMESEPLYLKLCSIFHLIFHPVLLLLICGLKRINIIFSVNLAPLHFNHLTHILENIGPSASLYWMLVGGL